MKKKLLLILLFVSLLFSVTGCFSKKALSTKDFSKIAEKNGLIVTDVKNQFVDFDYVHEATIALSTEGWQIEFYVLSDTYNAQEMYTKNKNKFELEDKNAKTKTVSLKNYTKYTQETNKSYKVLSRVDNTLIYVNESKDNKSKVNKLLKELGY